MMTFESQKLRKCSHCGWVHASISQDSAEDEIREFNKMFSTLDAKEQISLYDGQPAHLATYKQCANCASSYTDFIIASPSDLKKLKGKRLPVILIFENNRC